MKSRKNRQGEMPWGKRSVDRLSSADVLPDKATHRGKSTVHAARHTAHSRSCSKGDQRQDQQVFHQTLTCFFAVQAGKMAKEHFSHCKLLNRDRSACSFCLYQSCPERSCKQGRSD